MQLECLNKLDKLPGHTRNNIATNASVEIRLDSQQRCEQPP